MGRLVTENAAIVRRVADRRTEVGPGIDAGQTSGQRGRRSTGGAARRACDVPRVVGRAVYRVVALAVCERDRNIRLAEKRDARVDHPLRRYGCRLGDIVLHRWQAPRRGRARHLIAFLDGHRHAVKGSETLAFLQSSVSCLRPLPRLVAICPDDRVERRIVFINAREEMIEQFERAHLLSADERCKRGEQVITSASLTIAEMPATDRRLPSTHEGGILAADQPGRKRCPSVAVPCWWAVSLG